MNKYFYQMSTVLKIKLIELDIELVEMGNIVRFVTLRFAQRPIIEIFNAKPILKLIK